MYLTSTEYVTLTGRAIAEATIIRITMACKLLDSRIGNYPFENGYKIDSSNDTWYFYNNKEIKISQKQAVKLWVAQMITCLYLNNDMPESFNSIKLGRFSMTKGKDSNSLLPDKMNYVDTILISSGIINSKIDLDSKCNEVNMI